MNYVETFIRNLNPSSICIDSIKYNECSQVGEEFIHRRTDGHHNNQSLTISITALLRHCHLSLTWFVEQTGRDDHQGVEPPSRLIKPLRNEVSGEALLEAVNILEGVVQLRVWHGPRLEPAVKHLVHSLQCTATWRLNQPCWIISQIKVAYSSST